MPEIRRHERNKRPGVYYAVTSDGLELPVVDVTHPSFQLQLSEEKQQRILASFLDEQRQFARLPRLLRRALLRLSLRGSVIARGLRRAEGSFLDGMTTYLFKVGASNLGDYALPVDRRIASSLPGLAVRLRLSDMARLLADELSGLLEQAGARPLWLLNIAGGPGMDSLNALLLLQREKPELLRGRRCVICVLDADESGPAFGARALQALQAAGAPLALLDIEFRWQAYDWTKSSGLTPALAALESEGALGIVSSEGGLFEYGSDDDILANLQALGASRERLNVVGSVTRNDETMRTLKLTSTATTRPRGLEVFSALVAKVGWRVTRSIARPLSDQVALEPP